MFSSRYAGAMSTKHIRTTADLARFGAGLKIEVRACGAARTLDGFVASSLFGVTSLQNVARRAMWAVLDARC